MDELDHRNRVYKEKTGYLLEPLVKNESLNN